MVRAPTIGAVEPSLPWTLGERGRRWFDRLLVLGLVGLSLFYVLAGEPGAAFLSVAQVAPLWWRRSHAAAVFAAVALASALQVVVLDTPIIGQLAFPVAAYSGARWGGRATRFIVLLVTLCASLVAAWDWTRGWAQPDDVARSMIAPALSAAGIAVSAWALGVAGSQRDRYVRGLVDAAEQARRMAERDVALAAQDERARIAREMHDVVAHGLSVIVVQADGARYAAAKDPQVAVDTLATVADTGRASLAEMRRLLGLLRTGESGVRPQPTLSDVPHLVREAAASGTEVEFEAPDPLPAVADGVGLAAYRVVQEALTNVRKHAGDGVRVSVRITVSDALHVSVRDDGRGGARDPSDAGLGLVGMRERVGVRDGTLHAGPAEGGGWRVDARIPL